MDFKNYDIIAGILSRKLTAEGELTDGEQSLLEEWAGRSPENRKLLERFLSGEESGDYLNAISQIDLKTAAAAIDMKLRMRKRRRKFVRGISVAGAAAVVICAALCLFTHGTQTLREPILTESRYNAILRVNDSDPRYLAGTDDGSAWKQAAADARNNERADSAHVIKLEVPRGSEYRIVLNDGTVAWLNSESSIEYPYEFTGRRRVVRITGEVYFEVARDDKKEFIVNADDTEIKVLGTAFNVSVYGGTIVTTLVSGSVGIASPAGDARLRPGQQAIVENGGISVREVDAESYAAWIRGVFEFEDMTLEQIARQLERWYDVEFRFEGATGGKRFTGGTWKYVPLDEFLSKIERITDVRFVRDGNRVRVKTDETE